MTPRIQDLIKEFLERFCTEITDDDDPSSAELMMDNHTCIVYENVLYYVPEDNMLFTEDDEIMRELLNSTYPL